MIDERIRLYVNDHLGALVGALELARRSRRRNPTGALRQLLTEVIEALQDDRRLLRQLLDVLGGRPDRLKQGGAWLLEKLGRLKLNGAVLDYTDLDRVYELEALVAAVSAKDELWRTLAALQLDDERLAHLDLASREARDEDLLRRLRTERGAAAARAFGLVPAGVSPAAAE